jgi:hypothetical protein
MKGVLTISLPDVERSTRSSSFFQRVLINVVQADTDTDTLSRTRGVVTHVQTCDCVMQLGRLIGPTMLSHEWRCFVVR